MKKIKILMLSAIYATTSVEYLYSIQFQEILRALQEQSLMDQCNAAAAAGVAAITTNQIAAFPLSALPFMTSDQISQLTTAQIQAFTPQQITAFLPAQMALFTVPTASNPTALNQVAAFSITQIAALSPAQLTAMSNEAMNVIFASLTPTQVQSISMLQIQSLPAAVLIPQLKHFTAEQTECITPLQINSMGTSVTSIISDLSPAQFLSLSVAQIQALTSQHITDHIGNLSTTMISNLLPAQIATITTAQINMMTQAQLAALKAILINAAIITTTNNPALASQIAAITTAPGKGIPVKPLPVRAKSKKKTGYVGASLDKRMQAGNAKSLYEVNKAIGIDKTNRDSYRKLKRLFTTAKI